MTPEERTQQIMAEADRLVKECRRTLEEGERTVRGMGLDPEKVRQVAYQSIAEMSEEQVKELSDQLHRDQQEVEQASRHPAAAPASGSAPRRPRNMV